MKSPFRFAIVVAAMLALGLSTAFAQQAGKKEFAFKGKVEKVDTRAKTLTVNNENIPGWMVSMSMGYAVDKADDVLKTLKAGDQITAKVYDGDFKTLYDVKVVPQGPRQEIVHPMKKTLLLFAAAVDCRLDVLAAACAFARARSHHRQLRQGNRPHHEQAMRRVSQREQPQRSVHDLREHAPVGQGHRGGSAAPAHAAVARRSGLRQVRQRQRH